MKSGEVLRKIKYLKSIIILIVGDHEYKVRSLNQEFYLSFDINKTSSIFKITLNFLEIDHNRSLGQIYMDENEQVKRVIFKMKKKFMSNENMNLDEMLHYQWHSNNSIYTGYLPFPRIEDQQFVEAIKNSKVL